MTFPFLLFLLLVFIRAMSSPHVSPFGDVYFFDIFFTKVFHDKLGLLMIKHLINEVNAFPHVGIPYVSGRPKKTCARETLHMHFQSCTRSPLAFWSAGLGTRLTHFMTVLFSEPRARYLMTRVSEGSRPIGLQIKVIRIQA